MKDNINSAPTFSVIGKPNHGKSSIISALMMDDRIQVSSNTGTTKALVASSGNITLNGNRWKHYNITGLSVDLEEGQYVLPRITMGEDLANLRGQFTIKYHRIA